MRIVPDTNVLASGFVGLPNASRGASTQVVLIWLDRSFTLITSDFILGELNSVFQRRYFGENLTNEQRDFVLQTIRSRAEIVTTDQPIVGITSHWQDDLVLSAAISGSADYLVTGDAEFRRVEEYEGVKIRTPAEFLQELDAAQT